MIKEYHLLPDELQASRSEALGAPHIPQVQWGEVGGLEGAKRQIINTIQLPLRYPSLVASKMRHSGKGGCVGVLGALVHCRVLLLCALVLVFSLHFNSVALNKFLLCSVMSAITLCIITY